MRCNTVRFTAADGEAQSFPLDELLSRGALIASEVGGEKISRSMGAYNQLWVPGWPAKYFVRDIVEIQFSEESEPPTINPFIDDGHDYVNRPNVSVKASYVGVVGKPLMFEGYAQDYDCAIAGVQFSLDDGNSWTLFPIQDATAERWVYWHFEWTPEQAGSYRMKVRAVSESGSVSPIPAVHCFEVAEL